MDSEAFITEILNRPPIWMSKHPQHKYKNVIKRLWEEIKQCFPEYNVAQLKKKWKNLKDAYRKELRKTATSRSGDPGPDDENSMSQWKYFTLMTFLKEEFMPAENESNLTENEYQDLDASSQSEFQSTLSAPSSLENLRPREEVNKNQNTADVEKTEDYHFLMSILPEMQKLNSIQKIRVRNKINQVLMDELVSNMYGDNYTSRGYYTQPPPATNIGIDYSVINM
ncbi:unnamed protein product [Arctia plantaginis]|uniref:MADF domain-containing protein n=1 Tax=Arctia plantaginis TaxID=874455 RepID=A0A8S0YZ70_ARCPL|nr:unnamed protein product [Arctia plantaginis]CAB3250901.1 unnamed protein product [Arctia plantaginis]